MGMVLESMEAAEMRRGTAHTDTHTRTPCWWRGGGAGHATHTHTQEERERMCVCVSLCVCPSQNANNIPLCECIIGTESQFKKGVTERVLLYT
mgnify:CR=1 FL=1